MPSAGKCRRSFPGPPQNTKGLIYDNADQSPAKPLQGNNIPVADVGAVGCFLRSYWMELDAREGRLRTFGDRKSVRWGRRVSVSVGHGGLCLQNTKKQRLPL